MSAPQDPKVELPKSISRKPVVPGPNSWAQSQEKQRAAMKAQDLRNPTNRERYENKSMPKMPDESSARKEYLQPKAYIQPAIPLLRVAPSQKHRAVTDPIAPKPLFADKKASVDELRKNFMPSKPTQPKDEPSVQDEPTWETQSVAPTFSHISGKAARVLGMIPVSEESWNKTRTSAPTAPLGSVVEQDSSKCQDQQSANTSRQVQSSPVPTRRSLKESDVPTESEIARPTTSSGVTTRESTHETNSKYSRGGQALGNGRLAPPKLPSYGKVGNNGVVEEHGMYRVESFQAVIEDATNEEQSHSTTRIPLPQTSSAPTLSNKELLPPTVYSPSIYHGVWENDPAVVSSTWQGPCKRTKSEDSQGYSLPPFSPMRRVFQDNPGPAKGPPSGSSGMNMSYISNNTHSSRSYSNNHPAGTRPQHPTQQSNQGSQRSADVQPPLPSADSWASGSRGNSFASTNPPLSALLPPRWPLHHASNSVPSPPHSHREYQRPDPLTAGFAQLDLTIHHHIDAAFGSLSRLFTDKVDRILDQTIRRLEALDEGVKRGFKGVKGEVRSIRTDFGSMKGSIDNVGKVSDVMKARLQSLEDKIGALEKHIEEHACKCQQSTSVQDPVEPEAEPHHRAPTHRRTESADGVLGQAEQRQQYRSGGKAHESGRGSRSQRSNTLSGQTGTRASNSDRSTRGEYFAELGAALGPTPELRHHPAYSGLQRAPHTIYDENGVPAGMMVPAPMPYIPALGASAWYDQAFGQGH